MWGTIIKKKHICRKIKLLIASFKGLLENDQFIYFFMVEIKID